MNLKKEFDLIHCSSFGEKFCNTRCSSQRVVEGNTASKHTPHLPTLDKNTMALQISPRDTDLLLKQKNVLSRDVLDKYTAAGEITQTCLQYIISLINDSYHLGKHEKYSIAELCLLGDSFMQSLVNDKFKKKVSEKGIAQPVTIDVNNVMSGFAPELNDYDNEHNNTNMNFNVGDLVTINLGCHIDGYTSNVAHNMVIYPIDTTTLKPAGPLLGESADAICAAYLATEAVVTLLACASNPEKIPKALGENSGAVTGSLIRKLVDGIAESYNCVVVPTSKVRRIRRFLAGQAEGVVAERDFKGVVWSEQDQERDLLAKANAQSQASERQVSVVDQSKGRLNVENNPDNAIPSDEFVVAVGEVYSVDIKMSPINKTEAGVVTLESLDEIKRGEDEIIKPKHSIFIRDVSISEQLKLRNSRRLLSLVDKSQSVYPFKLAYVSEHFPLDLVKGDVIEQLNAIEQDVKVFKFGLHECINKHLFVNKAIVGTKFIPLKEILKIPTSTGVNGYDASNPTLPGLELPLPKLGLTGLKLKTLLKYGTPVTVAREMATVAITGDSERGLIRLGGGKNFPCSWVHSEYELQGETGVVLNELSALAGDARFGVKITECGVLSGAIATTVATESAAMEE
jgi:metalloprotease ARX1